MSSAHPSRTKVRTQCFAKRLRAERGSANVLGFIFALIILIPAMLLFMHMEGAKDARKGFDDAVVNTAKAAASATYTTARGDLRIDPQKAALSAQNAYDLYKPFISDALNVKLMNDAYPQRVTIDCKPDLTSGGEGCIGVTVRVYDEYKGGLLTHDLFPTFAFEGWSTADLVVTQ